MVNRSNILLCVGVGGQFDSKQMIISKNVSEKKTDSWDI